MFSVLILSIYAMFLSVCGLVGDWEMLRLGIFVPMALASFVSFAASIRALVNGPLAPNRCAKAVEPIDDEDSF
jgi:hypothetical protein